MACGGLIGAAVLLAGMVESILRSDSTDNSTIVPLGVTGAAVGAAVGLFAALASALAWLLTVERPRSSPHWSRVAAGATAAAVLVILSAALFGGAGDVFSLVCCVGSGLLAAALAPRLGTNPSADGEALRQGDGFLVHACPEPLLSLV